MILFIENSEKIRKVFTSLKTSIYYFKIKFCHPSYLKFSEIIFKNSLQFYLQSYLLEIIFGVIRQNVTKFARPIYIDLRFCFCHDSILIKRQVLNRMFDSLSKNYEFVEVQKRMQTFNAAFA